LDSLDRIETYQWVTRDKSRKIFSGRFCPLGIRIARTERGPRGYAEAQKCSQGKLNLCSDFLQSIVSPAVSPKPPQSRANRSRTKLDQHDRIRTKANQQLGLAEVRFAQTAVIPGRLGGRAKSTLSRRSTFESDPYFTGPQELRKNKAGRLVSRTKRGAHERIRP
jgi:hypothetical protein